MAKYLLIESRDPFESQLSKELPELVRELSTRGNEVTVYFVQNGVLPLRREAAFADTLSTLASDHVRLVADAFSLRERAITDVAPSIQISEIGELVHKLFEENTKVIWH